MPGMLKDIVDSIFSPETKPQKGVIKAMNYSFYGLFATLFALAFVTSWNKHVLVLSAVAVVLFASISWFITELGKIEDHKKAEQPSGKASSASSSTSAQSQQKRTQNGGPQDQVALAPGDHTYAEVATEDGTTSHTGSRPAANTRSKAGSAYSIAAGGGHAGNTGNGQDAETYAEAAAEEPPSAAATAIREDRQGLTERKRGA